MISNKANNRVTAKSTAVFINEKENNLGNHSLTYKETSKMLWRNQIWFYPPKFRAVARGPGVHSARENHSYLKPNLSNCKFKIAKKIFLNRYRTTMSLTFNLDDLRAPLVSPSYFSSDDPMEIDSISAAGSDDSDIQVIAGNNRPSQKLLLPVDK